MPLPSGGLPCQLGGYNGDGRWIGGDAWARKSHSSTFSREDRARYRQKVRRCLDVFAEMLRDARFDFDRPMTGMEIELNLIDDDAAPAMRNADVLAAIADPDFQTELGQFNVEINVPPRRLARRRHCRLRGRRARTASTPPRRRPGRSARTW